MLDKLYTRAIDQELGDIKYSDSYRKNHFGHYYNGIFIAIGEEAIALVNKKVFLEEVLPLGFGNYVEGEVMFFLPKSKIVC